MIEGFIKDSQREYRRQPSFCAETVGALSVTERHMKSRSNLMDHVVHESVRLGYRGMRPARFSENVAKRYEKNVNNGAYECFDRTRSIFVHIPKTAGVSLCQSLYGRDIIGHARLRHYQIVFDYGAFHSYFKFCFVRNPWDRLFSAYRFLSCGGWHEKDQIWAREVLSKYNNFEDFVIRGLGNRDVMSQIHMLPQYLFLKPIFPNQGGLDFIGRFETLNEDFEFVADRLGIEARLDHNNKSPADRTYREAYSRKMRSVVAEIYRQDIRSFSYDF